MKNIKILITVALSVLIMAVVVLWQAGTLTHVQATAQNTISSEKTGTHADHKDAKDKPKNESPSASKSSHTGADEKASPKDMHQDDNGEAHSETKAIRLNEAEMKKFAIEEAPAGPGKLMTHVSLPGEIALNADKMAHVVPRLAGVAREVRKNVGDTVKKGEILAVIESRDLADAKASYLAAVDKAALAQAKFSREERLWQKKISAEQEYLEARQALAEARITLRSAEQKLHALGYSDENLKELPKHHGQSYTRYEVVAPFDGTVIEKHITLGESLKEDADIFVVADLNTVWVNLSVYQKDLGIIRKGLPVSISTGHDDKETMAEISYVAPIVKEETRSAMARIILANSAGYWRPGMFVTAKVAVDDITVRILLPKSALQSIEDKSVVFVRAGEGFVPKPVVLGRMNDAHVEVTSGISQGDRCVISGAFTLKAQLSKGAFGDGHNH